MRTVTIDKEYLETLTKMIDALEKRVMRLENNQRPAVPVYDSTAFPTDAVDGHICIAPIIP